MTGVEVVIGNCLPEVHKIFPILGNEREKISNRDDASRHLSCYTSAHAFIWHRYGDMAV